jgi:glycosyltransferase involved in cell wall biosynthesis
MVKEYKLEDRIHIHPFTNHIQEYYSKAQVYVLSSRWEGMPLVLMEAMSHRLPVISSNLPVCQEIMGDFGMYFSVGDVKGMARQMKAAIQMDWQEKSEQALKIAARFDIETIINQWKQLIDER